MLLKGSGKMSKKKNKKRNGRWVIPENAADFFDPHCDDAFRAEHPVLYWLTVVAIIVLVLVGPGLYIILCGMIQPTTYDSFFELVFWMFGFISSFGISIGICNLFMIVYKQYLGHYVTIFSFAIGFAGSAIGMFFLWLL